MEPSQSRLAHWLQGAMKRHNLESARGVALYAGLSPDAVLRALRGGRSEPETIAKLAIKFKEDQNYLMELAGYVSGRSTGQRTLMLAEVASRATAGPGGSTDPQLWPYLPDPSESDHPFIVVLVTGDCLDPDIRPGERVVVDKWGAPRAGNFVVVRYDDEMLLKRVERRNGDLWLVANRHHEPMKLSEDVAIEGVVRLIMRRPPS